MGKTENKDVEVKTEKTAQATKPSKSKKGPNWFKRRWKNIKEIVSELKKVSWPTFGKVMKQLGVVMMVVIIFLVLIFVVDQGLAFALDLMRNK